MQEALAEAREQGQLSSCSAYLPGDTNICHKLVVKHKQSSKSKPERGMEGRPELFLPFARSWVVQWTCHCFHRDAGHPADA